jgi:ribonuclease Z
VKVTFLGTGGTYPCPSRTTASIALRVQDELLLFDCGEGAQRRLMESGESFMRVSRVFLSHHHGDHSYGLPGLLQTMALNGRTDRLEIHGPRGTRELVRAFLELGRPVGFEVRASDLADGARVEAPKFTVTAALARHSAPNLAFAVEEPVRVGRFDEPRALELGVPKGPLFGRLQRGESVTTPAGKVVSPDMVLGAPRRGRKFVYSGDTRPCESVATLARGADLLVHDSTHAGDLAEKAKEFMHSTCVEAARLAKEAGAARLALFHFSPRYEDVEPLASEAREVFPSTFATADLMTLDIPLPGQRAPGIQ